MPLSAHTFTDITRRHNPSIVAYYLAHSYITRAELIGQQRVRSDKEQIKRLYRRAFLDSVAKKYIKLSDELVRLESEFMRKV